MKTREPRRKVMIGARMRSGAAWGDVRIHNMSSRGLLAAADTEHPSGTIVEIRRINHVIVGRVVWQNGLYFGVRTQDVIDIDGMIAAKPPARKPGQNGGTADADRRVDTRHTLSIDAREAQSRRFAAAFQFAVLLMVIGGAALFAADTVGDVLSRPFATIGAQLDGSAGSGREVTGG